MSEQISTGTKPSKKNISFWVAIFATLLLVIVVTIIGIAYFKGTIAVNTPSKVVAGRNEICDAAVVEQYNKVINAEVPVDTNAQEYQQTIIDFGNKVREKENYDTDPTCLYISATTAIEAEDFNKAQEDITKLLTLVDNAQYVNSTVLGLSPVQQLQAHIKAYQENYER